MMQNYSEGAVVRVKLCFHLGSRLVFLSNTYILLVLKELVLAKTDQVVHFLFEYPFPIPRWITSLLFTSLLKDL